MKRRSFIGCSAAAVVLLADKSKINQASAQTRYPDRPIRLVVPFAPGGETDLVGRLWAQHVAPFLGQGVVIDNKSGAGGAIGSTEVARAKPDGYTLLAGTSGTHVVNPLVTRMPAYDPLSDFMPVSLVSITPFTVCVHPSLNVQTIQQLVTLIKASPGKYSYASAGAGTMAHLAGEMFRMQAGNIDLQHVPYKGAGLAIQDLIAGHIPIAMAVITSSLQSQHRAGRLRVLMVCSDTRLVAMPEVPSANEAGIPDLKVGVFNGIFVPAGTGATVIEILHRATQRAFHEGKLRIELEKAGAQAQLQSTPPWATAYLSAEIRRWTPVVRASGIRIE